MTTKQVAQYADPEGLSGPDIDLQVELRFNIMPDFLEEVGYTSWRRKYAVATINPGDQSIQLPADFYTLKAISLGTTSDMTFESDLSYIGDNPDLVLAAENATTATSPSGYYYQRLPVTPKEMQILKFGAPSDKVYTARYVYYSGIVFTDTATDVELDDFIPFQHQWCLVEWLKCVIFERRFGVGDNRFTAADANRQRKLARAQTNKEKTGTERPRFVN